MKSIDLYVIGQEHGVYEIVRVGEKDHSIVQTNIRTWEKAVEARKIWQARELEKDGRQTEAGIRHGGREDGRHADESR